MVLKRSAACLAVIAGLLVESTAEQCATGARAPSLMQVRSLSSRSDAFTALNEYAQLVENMAEKVAGHNYTLGEAEKSAIEIIEKFIDDMVSAIDTQFAEDQAEVNRARDSIQSCATTANTRLLTVSNWKSTMETNRDSHTSCRNTEVQLNSEKKQACLDYDTYRMSSPAVPPACMQSRLTAAYISTSDDTQREEMETCLVKTHEWLQPLYQKYLVCDRERGEWTNQTEECKLKQGTFEASYCSYALKLEDACDEQTQCRGQEISSRNETHAGVSVSEAARKADFVTGQKIKCFFRVFDAANVDKTGIVAECKGLTVDTSAYDIIYPPIPPPTPCQKEAEKPCDPSWVTSEYDGKPWTSGAPAHSCTACPAPE